MSESPEEIPLICDERQPPVVAIGFTRRLTKAEVERFKAEWNAGNRDAVLRQADIIQTAEPGLQWPDAEYCAA